MDALTELNAQQTALKGAWLLLARRLAAQGEIEAAGLALDMRTLAAAVSCVQARAAVNDLADLLASIP